MVEDGVPRRDLSTAARSNCVFTQGVTRVQWVDQSAVEHSAGTYRVKIHTPSLRVQELCDNRGGRPGLTSLISLMVSVEVKQH